ncbi:MAG: DUF2848 family protein [Actinomycetota bacterium]
MTIELRVDGTVARIEPEVLVVVGYTGADEAAVRHHIDELAAEGVAPPPRVPMYWAMPASGLTQRAVMEAPSPATSGEIELALVVDGPEVFLAAGSDHTCREAEAIDIRLSKLICPTPLSSEAWPWSSVAERWVDLELASVVTIEGASQPYQRATAGVNRPPQELLEGIPWPGDRPQSFVVLCGTVPAIGGIRPADRFTGSITDPATGRTIALDYEVRPVRPLATEAPDDPEPGGPSNTNPR